MRPNLSPLMVLGTTSGCGKSLMTTAICRVLRRNGERPIPFKGQNMSNNAWVDESCGEMAYSQALQAWAAGVTPNCAMNPILLKPKGDGSSEVIHLGRSVGITKAENYYQDWFLPGWNVIRKALLELNSFYGDSRFVLEGAGSPVEVNLQKRDLTNLRLAQFLNAKCILVADIERGGVFAQLIGTLSLLTKSERKLIKGILINKFRGNISLFDEGRSWLEDKTGIPVLGVMPWLNDVYPPEDSLDLFERKVIKTSAEIEIAVIKLSHISNFSDLDPLESEPSIQLKWIDSGASLGSPDCVIIPGSKQTLKDLEFIKKSGLDGKLNAYLKNGGHVFAICGGMQILGHTLSDPENLEGCGTRSKYSSYSGLDLIPVKTIFKPYKNLIKREISVDWPKKLQIKGFEIHHGLTEPIDGCCPNLQPISSEGNVGWFMKTEYNSYIVGTYLHGIFDNGIWRRTWINMLREKKGLPRLDVNLSDYSKYRNDILDKLANVFEHNIDMSRII